MTNDSQEPLMTNDSVECYLARIALGEVGRDFSDGERNHALADDDVYETHPEHARALALARIIRDDDTQF